MIAFMADLFVRVCLFIAGLVTFSIIQMQVYNLVAR